MPSIFPHFRAFVCPFKLPAIAFAMAALAAAQTNVLTYQDNPARTGANLNETILNHANVNAASFGKLFSYTLDGWLYAQPLYMAGVPINGKGRHNVVFVATAGDSVYALDADNGAGANAVPLWQWSAANPPNVIPVPASLFGGENDFFGCPSFATTVGIVGTPVIDPASLTMYLVTVTKEISGNNATFVHRFHAIDITTGFERPGSGAAINSPSGFVSYYPQWMVQRTGLLLLNGNIYMGFSAPCDHAPYSGFLISFNTQTLQQNSASFITVPQGEGGIWGGAPAADSLGNIFLMTGNGYFDGITDFGSAFVKLSPGFQLLDYFAPFNVDTFLDSNGRDLDLGSSMPILLPDSAGVAGHPHLMIGAGKEGKIYLIDRDQLGQWNGIVDNLPFTPYATGEKIFGRGVFFNNQFYVSPAFSPIESFSVAGGQISPATNTSNSYTNSFVPGAGLNLSANGSSDGILWALYKASNGSAVLDAYDATNLQTELYNSTSGNDGLGVWANLSLPTVAQGKVFAVSNVSQQGSLAVFGLRNASCAADVSGQISVTRGGWRYNHATNSYIQTVTLTNNGSSLAGPVSLVLDNLTSTSQLISGSGTTSCGSATGSFYQNATLNLNSLGAGQSTQVYLSASNSSAQTITFNTRVLAGSGVR